MTSSNLVDVLREAIKRNDDWSTVDTKAAVINTARSLVQAIDQRAATIEFYRAHVTPTDEAIKEMLDDHG
jgi:hypothetical protein